MQRQEKEAMSASTQSLPQVADFIVLPLRFTSKARNNTDPVEHLLYIKPHESRTPDPSSDRSLFIANIPIDATEHHFRFLFSDQLNAGRVERVQYDSFRSGKAATRNRTSKKRKRTEIDVDEEIPARLPNTWTQTIHHSGSTAVVVFVDRSGMELSWKAVGKASKRRAELVWGLDIDSKIAALGSQRYLAHHNSCFPPREQLQSIVDKYMTAFSAQEDARAKARAKQRQVPDEDGFITVTRGGRIGPARQEAAQQKMEELKRKAEEKKEGMSDFYRFQNRERKKQAALDLIQKFESDKQKAEHLSKRQKDRFKPM